LREIHAEPARTQGAPYAFAMPSNARAAFEENRKDVERLIQIHADLAGETPGRKHGVEVLNKSGIVLMCAVWEAYCEDLAAEAVEHLVQNTRDADSLPKALRKVIAAELAEDKNELAMWTLAGDGWKKILRSRLADIAERRNRSLNTPKSSNIDELFEEAVGLKTVSSSWHWHNVSAETAREKLNGYVRQRGDVAHRSSAASSIKKSHLIGFVKHAERLVDATDARVNTDITKACGVSLF
jgi:hypothetical protein